ncbi:MAG: transporter substrate-binding domain-containing protein, partial [Gammaproteobacteria bacterium]|nr:transporter substrate-binding domain-containing protein [Gammaproteobacteria bacterium]
IIAMQAALAGVEFTRPLYFTANYAYGRTDEARFDSELSQLNSEQFAIVTTDGAFDHYLAETRFPIARRVELPALADPATVIENIVTGKADVSFLAAFTADGYMANNPGKIKKLTPEPVAVFDTAMMIKAGDAEFSAMLDAALRQLRGDGFIDNTLDKYGVDASATLRVAAPYKLPNK